MEIKKSYTKYYIIIIALAVGLFCFFAIQAASSPDKKENAAPIFEAPEKSSRGLGIERKIFGYSAKGRPIEGYDIGNGKNILLMFGSVHGNEMGTADLLEHLVLEIALYPDIVDKNKKLIIVPILNPDGYLDRMDKLNASEVNIDLNFATSDWKKYGPKGTYGGPYPFSESESRTFKKIVEDYNPGMVISFHAFGAFVAPEAGEASVQLAKWYAEKTGYDFSEGYDYPGTSVKWFAETTGKTAVTVEISKHLLSDWETNKPALLELISASSSLQTM